MVPFDPERTEEITMAAKQTKIPFDMMNNGMTWPEDNSQFEKQKETLDFLRLRLSQLIDNNSN